MGAESYSCRGSWVRVDLEVMMMQSAKSQKSSRRHESFVLVLLDLVLSCLVVISLRPALFRKEMEGEADMRQRGGRGAGQSREGQTVVRMDGLDDRRIYFQFLKKEVIRVERL